MSRHGVIIHCSYCDGPGHNIGGCSDKKNGMPRKQYVSKKKKEVVRLLPDSSDEDEPVITQVIHLLFPQVLIPMCQLTY
jgi:hypothetical protein